LVFFGCFFHFINLVMLTSPVTSSMFLYIIHWPALAGGMSLDFINHIKSLYDFTNWIGIVRVAWCCAILVLPRKTLDFLWVFFRGVRYAFLTKKLKILRGSWFVLIVENFQYLSKKTLSHICNVSNTYCSFFLIQSNVLLWLPLLSNNLCYITLILISLQVAFILIAPVFRNDLSYVTYFNYLSIKHKTGLIVLKAYNVVLKVLIIPA